MSGIQRYFKRPRDSPASATAPAGFDPTDPLNLGYDSNSSESSEDEADAEVTPGGARQRPQKSRKTSTPRVGRSRDKKFKAAWLDQFKWLTCKRKENSKWVCCDYSIVGDRNTGSVLAPEDAVWLCAICDDWLLEAPADKLGAGSHRWPRGLLHCGLDRVDILRQHAENQDHCLRLELRKLSLDTARGPHGPPPMVPFQPAVIFQLQGLKNAYQVAYYEEALTGCERYRLRIKLEPDAVVGGPLSSYTVLEFLDAAAMWVRFKQFLRRRRVHHITGKMWDGGTDISCADSELLGETYTADMYAHATVGFTSATYLRVTAFIADCKYITKRLSMLIQRDGISPLEINLKVDTTVAELLELIGTPGLRETEVVSAYDPETELYRGIPVHDWEESEEWMRENRKPFLEHLVEFITSRVTCTGDLVEARIIAFRERMVMWNSKWGTCMSDGRWYARTSLTWMLAHEASTHAPAAW